MREQLPSNPPAGGSPAEALKSFMDLLDDAAEQAMPEPAVTSRINLIMRGGLEDRLRELKDDVAGDEAQDVDRVPHGGFDRVPDGGYRHSTRTVEPRMRGQIVGRRDILEIFQVALDTAVTGRFQFLSLSGDPGIGKTRLLTELWLTAERRGFPAYWGRAAELERVLPFGALIDALDERVGWAETTHPRLLARVFPSLMVPGVEEAGAGEDSLLRYQVYCAIRRLLEELAALRGVALLLDDLHWADDATVELLEYLVRHPPRGPVLVAVAFRGAQAPARLGGLRQGEGKEITVGPLSFAETQELLGPDVSRSHAGALHEASGGNPFYLQALARMSETDGAELPADVRSLPQKVLDSLSPAALTVARAAAVAVTSDEFEPALVAEASRLPGQAILDACDELVSRDMVRATGSGRFRFRHPLIRQAAYESSSTTFRLAAHARLAAHLAALGAPASVRAHHVEASASLGDEMACATLVAAAKGVTAHAPATAAHWLRAALGLLPDDRPERLDLMLELARLLHVSGRSTESRDTTRELLRRLPPHEHARRADAALLCSQLERQLDRPDEARAVLIEELGRMPSPRSAAAIPLRWRLVTESLMRVDARAAQAILDQMPDPQDDWEPGLDIAIAAVRPMAAYGGGRIADAVRLSEHAAALVAAAPDEVLAKWLEGLAWLCWADVMLGRYEEAMRNIDRCMGAGRSTGNGDLLGYFHCAKARLLCLLGRLPEAAEAAAEAAEVARLLGSGQQLVFALTQQCLVATLSGEQEDALRYGEEAVGSGIGEGQWWGAMAWFAYGVALVFSGDTDKGMRFMLDAFRHEERPLLDPGTLVACCEIMATFQALRGRPEEAAEWAGEAEALALPELPAETALALLARAQIMRASEPAAAAELAASAAGTLREMGRRLDAGRALQAAGQMYAAAGNRVEAGRMLARSARIFDESGAKSFHAGVMDELIRLDAHVPPEPAKEPPYPVLFDGPHFPGPNRFLRPAPFPSRTETSCSHAPPSTESEFTQREWKVAELVTAGYTNQQISDTLYISARTVATDLGRVYTKLGVRSRVDVAHSLSAQRSNAELK